MNIDELYLESEADIKNNQYGEAFKICESILYEDPRHAPAHNSMGWLLKTQFDDYDRAENHFLTAIKCAPMYPHPYFHYATFLTDLERYDDLVKHLDKCLAIPTLEKSWIFSKRGIMEELRMNYSEAISCYEKAILSSLNDDKIKMYGDDIERCKAKQEIVAKNGELKK
jgi:tetratricopeptide (TPR) repeat protein